MLLLSVKLQLSSSCCFARATAVIFFVLFCPCNRYLFLFSTYGVPLAIAAFTFLFDLLASHSSEHLSFVLLCFLFSFLFFVYFFLFLSFLVVWLILLCYRTRYSSTHLLCLDELRLFGLLCFTVVCDHRICISMNQHGLWVY